MRLTRIPLLTLALLAATPASAQDSPFPAAYTPTFDGIHAAFEAMAAAAPETVLKTHLVTTAQGRELAVWTFGNRTAPTRALLLCNHHGDEQWVAQLCLDFSRWLMWARGRDPVVDTLLTTTALDVVPIGNPDGFARGSRWTSRGNDINRNFPFMWGHTEPGTSNARPGPGPASEPETRALMDYQSAFAGRWLVILNYHLRYENSDGRNYILLPWAYTRGRTLTMEEMEAYRPFLPSVADAPTFTVDTVPNVFYPCPGTHTDWSYATFGAPALTMELGHGYRLPPRDRYLNQLLPSENLPVFRHFLRGIVAAARAP